MLGTPEARLVCSVTTVTAGVSFVLTPISGEHDAGLGISTITVATTMNPAKVRLTERVEVRLAALGG
jgi:hypothetical protein